MKNRTSVILVELAVMLLVFALAAALCLRAFAWADQQSLESSRRDEAYLQLQSAGETLKHFHGDFAAAAQAFGGSWDGNKWVVPLQQAQLSVTAVPEETDTDYLGAAYLAAYGPDGECLAQWKVCWQEVSP